MAEPPDINQEDKYDKLEKNIKLFLGVYKVLSPDGRATFEAQIASAMAGMDEKNKNLYQALIKAAKAGLSTEQVIKEMEKIR